MVITYLDAISQALREEMRRDPDVFLLGEDIAEFGGAFKITRGFLKEFGADRVIDTPISESGFVGAACAAAIEGLRPVVEFQFADFIACAFDQIVNYAAKANYRWGTPVPVVFRGPSGGGFRGGPFHSQNPEAWFMHAPGLKVVAPSTPEDAKGMLIGAIRDPNPVVFCEHKNLYRRVKGEVPEGTYVTETTARVAQAGTDLTIVAYGAMVHEALRATASVDASIEVLDLRSLVPLDETAIIESVRKTSRILILDEANATCAAGAQVAAIVADRAFEHLDAPVRRLATPDVPIPFSPPLESTVLPNVDRIEQEIHELLSY
jgi:2-oxoisovalerate dehydrogenase E1 component beta subunit